MRDITGAVEAAVEAEHVPMLAFVEMQFASGTVRVCNAYETVPWNGFNWLGLGNLGSIEPIEESTELQMNGIGLQLSGVNPALISTALGEQYQGRACKIWFAPLNPTTYVPIVDPIGPFRFRMDTMSIEKGKTATISVTAENRLADWDRARVRRYTDEDQQAEFPGDRFFEFVPELQEKEIIF
jgi:hypothetical protein